MDVRYAMPAVLACALVLLAVGSAEAQSSGMLTLDPIPSKAKTGSTIVFSGQLSTASGYAIPGATIYIKDDVDFGSDTVIGTITTHGDGRFEATWAAQERGGGAWDFYATYEGGPSAGRARSTTYSVSVSSYYDPATSNNPYGSGHEPNRYSTHLTLDRIPTFVHAGDSVTFSGRLTANGQPLANAFVKVSEDDPLSKDQILGYDRTDSGGRFSVAWKAGAGLVEDDFDVYAVFDGDSVYKRDRTSNQVMTVQKYGGHITLDHLPKSAAVGDRVTFSGTLSLDGFPTEGAIVYIKDEDPGTGDDLMATGYVDRFGRFSADWFANYMDEDSTVDVYAVFEGNDLQYRLTTCDDGPTRSFGASCIDTIPLRIHGSLPTQPDYVPTRGEYMELYYSLDLTRAPHVAIVPNPDSHSEVRGHIAPIQEGLMMWESYLGREYGGRWDVTFEVIEPGTKADSRPDIIMNLDTQDDHAWCADYAGWADIYEKPSGPIQTHVCSTHNGKRISNANVAATAAHEFIHAMGLGHTFNKRGDFMCSAEAGVPTCPAMRQKSKTPSGINLAAIIEIYGADGFRNPNNSVLYEEKFVPSNGAGDTYVPRPQDPAPRDTGRTNECPRDDYIYDQDVDRSLMPGWYMSYTICSLGEISYSFSTDNKRDGFEIYLLPPETDVNDFIQHQTGEYYTCEEYEKSWHKKSNTCYIESGAKIVVYNSGSTTININGWLRN